MELEEEFGKRLDQPWLLPDVLCTADTITPTLNTTIYFGDAVKEVYKDDSYNLANFWTVPLRPRIYNS